MSRPVVVIQSGDAFENRARVLPVAVAALAHGWDPVVLVDDLGAASLFLAHGAGVVAVGALEGGAAPADFDDVDPDELAPLALASHDAAGRRLGAAEWSDILAESGTLWRLLDELSPSALFVWNGHTGVWANALRVYKARRGLPGGFMERGPYADAVFVDAEGVNGDASFAKGRAEESAVEAAETEAAAAPPRPGLIGRLLARFAPSEAQPPLANGRDRVVFVPLQVADDSNILLHSPRIRRMRDLALFALALARALGPGWRVVARPHPEERPGARPNLPADPLLEIDGETPLETWLDRAAVCLTVNSNVGLSAALAGAVVVTLGEGIYCRQPFVVARQDCEIGRAVADVRRRLDGPPPAPEARAFMERLTEGSLFRLGDAAATASARLERCGLLREAGAAPGAPSREVRIERPAGAFADALARLAALKAGTGEIAVDFDFEPDETLFLTYRRNREPLTRDFLIAKAEAALGSQVRLSPTHRALGRRGAVLMAHSRRLPENVGEYDLVLDEFGLPHARLYLAD